MSVRRLLKHKGNYVPFIRSAASIRDVIEKLDIDDVGALVVTDDDQTILGLISERDIVRGLQKHGDGALNLQVTDLMTKGVITCDVSDPLSDVMTLMDKHQFRHVPITDAGRLCGIIHMLDVVKYRLDEIRCEAEALKDYVGRA